MEDTFIQERDHYDNLKAELGYDTVFDVDLRGCKPLDYKYFTDDKPLMITYKVIKDMGPTFNDTEWVTFTAVAKDGTLAGPNLELLKSVCAATTKPVIASGGISNIDDIPKVKEKNAWGVILGKALYENKITIEETKKLS